MVHPITGKTISSYKKAETWQRNDFGGMAQGDNKTGQKGTNEMIEREGRFVDQIW
jgi:hypothetical protein